MKTIISKSLLILLSLFALSSCDKDEPTDVVQEVQDLVIEMTETTVEPRQSVTIPVKSGSGHYQVSIESIGIAKASVDKDQITLTGVTEGQTVLTVTDKLSSQSKTIGVTVSNKPVLLLSHSKLIMPVGDTKIVNILNGSGAYEVRMSDDELGSYYIEDNKFVFTAKKIANGSITITDVQQGLDSTFEVELTSIPLIIQEKEVEVLVNTTHKVSIDSGSGDYAVTFDTPDIIEFKVAKSSLTIKALAPGEGVMTIVDNASGDSQQIKITTTLQSLTTDRDGQEQLKAYMGFGVAITILSGNGQYTIDVEDSEVISATLDGERVVITPLKLGESQITITDTMSGESFSTTVVVSDVPDRITFKLDGEVITKLVFEPGANYINLSYETDVDEYLKFYALDKSVIELWEGWNNDLYVMRGGNTGTTYIIAKGYYDGEIYGILPVEVK
ncbi:MAG: hypothetical protein Q4E10_01575 [Porphyromonas sp.]|nr:hypothetical protein [Porphyromonas sp.]